MPFLFRRALLLVAAGVFAGMAISAQAAESLRYQKWEFSLMYRQQVGAIVTGPKGATVDFKDSGGAGLSFGYNPNDYLNVAFDLAFNSPRYVASFTDAGGNDRTIKRKSDFFTTQVNATLHLLPTKVTPFVSGGFGWAAIDSNVSSGTGYCVPDYYWGWYCYQDSYRETNFTYNASVGLRADIDEYTFVRATYGRQYIDFSAPSQNQDFAVIKFELGFKM